MAKRERRRVIESDILRGKGKGLRVEGGDLPI
jgi:hypothetical protein